jgi:hypothetical protein
MPFEEGIVKIIGGVKKQTIDNAYAKYLTKPRAESITYDEFAEKYREARKKQHIRQQEKRLGGAVEREKAVKTVLAKESAYEAKKAQEKLQALKNIAEAKLAQDKEFNSMYPKNVVYLSPAEYERRKDEPVRLGDPIKLTDMTEMFRAFKK